MKEKPDWAERILRSRARFYQEGVKHGTELEQERIVEMLEDNLKEFINTNGSSTSDNIHGELRGLEKSISLIKGEQK